MVKYGCNYIKYVFIGEVILAYCCTNSNIKQIKTKTNETKRSGAKRSDILYVLSAPSTPAKVAAWITWARRRLIEMIDRCWGDRPWQTEWEDGGTNNTSPEDEESGIRSLSKPRLYVSYSVHFFFYIAQNHKFAFKWDIRLSGAPSYLRISDWTFTGASQICDADSESDKARKITWGLTSILKNN